MLAFQKHLTKVNNVIDVYEISHIRSAEMKSNEEWSSQLWMWFVELCRKPEKKIQDFNGIWTRDLAILVWFSKQTHNWPVSNISDFIIVQLLLTKIVHFYDKSMKLCQITTNPKTNISGYGAKPNSTLNTSTAQALKWPTWERGC